MKAEQEIESIVCESRSAVIPGDIKALLIADLGPVAERMDGYTAFAASAVVTTGAQADEASDVLQEIDRDLKLVKGHDVLTKITDGLFRLHRKATAFRALFTDPMERDKRTIRSKVVSWQQEEQRKAAALQAKLQAEADAKARKEREALEKKAASMKTEEKQEQYRQQAAEIVTPTVTVAAPKAIGTRKTWVVKSIDRAAFLVAAAQDANLQGYIEIKETALARSKAANAMLTVPGVVFVQEER